MFYKRNNTGYKKALEGVTFKTLAYGEKTLLGEFKLEKGSTVPMHKHHHEQTGYLISGRMIFNVGSEKIEVEPGDGWCLPGNVEHGVDVIEDSLVVEVFSPVREEYLP